MYERGVVVRVPNVTSCSYPPIGTIVDIISRSFDTYMIRYGLSQIVIDYDHRRFVNIRDKNYVETIIPKYCIQLLKD